MNWNNIRKEGLAFRDEESMPGMGNEESDDLTPYSSISSRQPLEDISLEGQANQMIEGDDDSSVVPSLRQSVMQKVSSRVAPPQMSGSIDPLMQQFNDKESELQQIRNEQRDANTITNVGQALSIAAQGANKPESTDSLYKNIASQNKDLLSSREGDLDRRQKVMASIETRKTRDLLAKLQHDDRVDRRNDTNNRYASTNREGDRLPLEDKEVVKDLSKKNASKIAIANQIDAVMGRWDELPDDQKVAQGRQLLKVLNSTEGADAVGSEEAKRLGGKLEYAMGNFFNSNPTQFGRDLPGFKEQGLGTSRAIRDAIASNDKEVKRVYSKVGIHRDVREPGAHPVARSSGMINEANAGESDGRRQVVKKQFSKSRNKTKIVYSDGSEEFVDGNQ